MIKDLTYIPLEQAKSPSDGVFECLLDRWWIVHPEKGLAIYRGVSPQCNSHESIAQRLLANYEEGHELRFIERAYVPWTE